MSLVDRPKRIYWDSCAWIGFINSEANKIQPLRSIWEDAERGEYEIWTSVYAYIEVIKGIAAHGEPYPLADSDVIIDRTLSQNWVKRVQIDIQIAKMARDLKRRFHTEGLKKRPDAIHLASAIYHNAEELHTYNGNDLLHLNGKVETPDGKLLKIINPGVEYIKGDLFAAISQGDNGES